MFPQMTTLLCVLGVFAIADVALAFKACMRVSSPSTVVRGPGDAGYDTAVTRGIYPSPAPAFVAEVRNRQQISDALKCAASTGFKVCTRSGGHSFIGQSTCTGVMIDVHFMKSLQYNAQSQQVTVESGNTLGELLYGVLQNSAGGRMVGIGLCPSVGIGGYLLGGGFNPYSGITGLTCESMVSADFVLADGSFITASRTSNPELFWASCGGGGGVYGVMYQATLNTNDAGVFNNNVFFRYQWPKQRAGEILSKWMDYKNEDGRVWVRAESSAIDGFVMYGVCWDASTTAGCVSRLNQAEFFQVPGRTNLLLQKSNRLAEFQAFIGPFGNWARQLAARSDRDALVGHNFIEAGVALKRQYSSGFYKFSSGKPSVALLQQVADLCSGADRSKVDFMICQFNPWEGRHQVPRDDNAFAHRGMDAFTEYIGGKNSAQTPQEIAATMAELSRIHSGIHAAMRPYLAGLYVNYPEFGLEEKDWGYLYWGSGLQRLANLRQQLDPNELFTRLHSMPKGTIPCPGSVTVSGTGTRRSMQIVGYPMGQISGMRTEISLSPGCSIAQGSATGAAISSKAAGIYEAVVNGNSAFQVTLSAATCTISARSINGISCSASTNPPSTTTARPPVSTTTGPTVSTNSTCHNTNVKCMGASGKPFVQWKACCKVGDQCLPVTDPNDWGSVCRPAGSSSTTTAPPTSSTSSSGSCHATNVKCMGAPNRPFVEWKPCCNSADSCQPVTDPNDWGSVCRPLSQATTSPSTTASNVGCHATNVKCMGVPGRPFVQWKPCCNAADSCLPVTNPNDWGFVCRT